MKKMAGVIDNLPSSFLSAREKEREREKKREKERKREKKRERRPEGSIRYVTG